MAVLEAMERHHTTLEAFVPHSPLLWSYAPQPETQLVAPFASAHRKWEICVLIIPELHQNEPEFGEEHDRKPPTLNFEP